MIAKLGKREVTMRLALKMLAERGGTTIVETGCAYNPDDWSGAGQSTLVFGEWAEEHDGQLFTVDIDSAHLTMAMELTEPWSNHIAYHLGDSVRFLHEAGTELKWRRIDLLYLDSHDYPYGELLDLYGGKTDLDAAVASLDALSEAEVVERHGEVIAASQRHAAKEAMAALSHLAERALVLIDDARLPGGGKARLARAVLDAYDFHEVLTAYQTLWARG